MLGFTSLFKIMLFWVQGGLWAVTVHPCPMFNWKIFSQDCFIPLSLPPGYGCLPFGGRSGTPLGEGQRAERGKGTHGLPAVPWAENTFCKNTDQGVGLRPMGAAGMESSGRESGPQAGLGQTWAVQQPDSAFQIWACPHTSRRSWLAGSLWGTAAAPGTPASAARRTQVSLPASPCLPGW